MQSTTIVFPICVPLVPVYPHQYYLYKRTSFPPELVFHRPVLLCLNCCKFCRPFVVALLLYSYLVVSQNLSLSWMQRAEWVWLALRKIFKPFAGIFQEGPSGVKMSCASYTQMGVGPFEKLVLWLYCTPSPWTTTTSDRFVVDHTWPTIMGEAMLIATFPLLCSSDE